MKLWNNPEARRAILLELSLTVLSGALGLLHSPVTALALWGLGGALTALSAWETKQRYRRLELLSTQLDEILHGQPRMEITDYQEGELSVLTSTVTKMLLVLREKSDLLQADKQHLADAIADIFHQLRTPLTSMNLMVTLLMQEDISPERRQSLCRNLSRQLERTRWLVEALLKMSKIDAGTVHFRRERVAVADMLEAAAAPLRIPMELRGVTLRLPAGTESFLGDGAWSTEAVGNLLKNAMEHTPEGGSITVSCEENALYTKITVADSGEGFQKEEIPHLFERFYRGKNAAPESIGIGLALSRMIFAAQNATVDARNAPGGGAEFTVKYYKTVV